MKTIYTMLLLVAMVITSQAQVTTDPILPFPESQIEISLDVTGTALENYTGTIYAHTGVTVNGVRWQNIIGNWGDNNVQPALTNQGNNIHTFTITPDVYTFYGVNTQDEITELSMVFRSADTNLQTSPDIFVPLYDSNVLSVVITTPATNSVFALSENITIQANATQDVDFNILVNGSFIATQSGTEIVENYTLSTTGDYTITVEGSVNGIVEATDEISVYVPITTQNETQPSGLKNGINYNTDGTITFKLTAPLKENVMLIGDFNEWRFRENFQMKKDNDDFWITLTAAEIDLNTPEEYAYQYVADFNIYIADPFATKVLDPNNDADIDPANYPNLKEYPEDAFGIVSTFEIGAVPYNWETNNFVRPDQDNLVIYELLVRDFSEEDSFDQVLQRLDYLEGLGVNAIEFMPLSEFEGNDSWGYNVSFHNALDKYYGTPDKLKELIDACHARGIAVILDVVYNHAFSQSSLCQLWWDETNFRPSPDNPYLNVTPTHDFNVGYDFNHESNFTKEYVKQTLQQWVNEYRFDGFRFDLSKGFTQNNTLGNVPAWNMFDQSRVDILEDYATTTWDATSNDLYMILEHLSDNEEEEFLSESGFMIWGKMTDQFNQNTMGYVDNNDVSAAYHANRGWDNPRLIAYMESHDEERLMFKNQEFGNSVGGHNAQDLETALDRTAAATAIFYSIPGPKMLWQFGELGYDISIDENGRTGRKPIPWTLGYDVEEGRDDLYTLTATMIALKQEYPVFNSLDNDLDLDTPQKRINLYHPDVDVVVIANFGMTQANINPNFSETGSWFDFFSEEEITVTNTSAAVQLPPGAFRIFTSEPLDNPLSLDDSENYTSLTVYPNPSQGVITFTEGIDNLRVYNMLGQLVLKNVEKVEAFSPYSLEKLPNGMYVIIYAVENRNFSHKIMIER